MVNRQRILVTGAQGNLGQDFLRLAADQPDFEWIGTTPDRLNLAGDQDSIIQTLREISPDVIVNTAAYTDVDGAETHADDAMAVNGRGPKAMAEWATDTGAYIIHISTDYVFDGKKGAAYDPSDIPNPINTYGKSKLAGEAAILSMLPDTGVVIRTCWLYGSGQKGFVWFLIRAAQSQSPAKVADDQWGTPTWTDDLARMIDSAIATRPTGILHGCSNGMVTRWDQAQFLFECLGADPALLNPVPTSSFNFPAPRPHNTAMEPSFADAPDWQSGTIAFLEQKGLSRVHV